MFKRIAKLARPGGLLRNESGAFAIALAGFLPLLLSMIALGVEAGLWFADRRLLQNAADAAAMGGAFELYRAANAPVEEAATVDAGRNGFSAVNGATIAVNRPPTSGTYAGNSNAVEVILSKPASLLYAGNFLSSLTVSARAVGIGVQGDPCVLALDTAATPGIGTQGNPLVTLNGCGMIANSTSSQAIKAGGSSSMIADFLRTPGNYSGNVTVTQAYTGASATADPFAALAVPSYGACAHTNYTASGSMSPGVYCNGLSFGGDVVMAPGTYIVSGGSVSASGNVRISGSGVTIILTGPTGNIATLGLTGGATFTLSAPTTGTYAGVVIFQDRLAPASGTNTMNGNVSTTITGALYFPNQALVFGGSNNSTGCTRLIARTITFKGNAQLANNCTGTGLSMNDTMPSLVE